MLDKSWATTIPKIIQWSKDTDRVCMFGQFSYNPKTIEIFFYMSL